MLGPQCGATSTASALLASSRTVSSSQAGTPPPRPQVVAGPDRGDAAGGEMLDRVLERQRAEVQGVVVGQGDQVDAQAGETLGGQRRRAEVERLARSRPGAPARGHAA